MSDAANRASAEELVEFRCNVPRWAFDVFDAVRRGRSMTKQALGSAVVEEWARREAHVATVVQRITRGHGIDAQADWSANGD